MWEQCDGIDDSTILHRQFTAYLVTAIRRTKIHYLQSKIRVQQYELSLENQDVMVAFQTEPDMILALPLIEQLESVKLQQALAQVKKRDLYILFAKVLEGRSFVEIAVELNIKYSAVTTSYYRMIKRLREYLGGEDE